jgi:hypothetical protein
LKQASVLVKRLEDFAREFDGDIELGLGDLAELSCLDLSGVVAEQAQLVHAVDELRRHDHSSAQSGMRSLTFSLVEQNGHSRGLGLSGQSAKRGAVASSTALTICDGAQEARSELDRRQQLGYPTRKRLALSL